MTAIHSSNKQHGFFDMGLGLALFAVLSMLTVAIAPDDGTNQQLAASVPVAPDCDGSQTASTAK